MSRENSKYPRIIESKNSYLRIKAPEHLDIALEGLIRKVLKEQPKMDDIYAFAADYFDMLLKIREKTGIKKLTVQDICPHHNEEDAKEMVKLASAFAKSKTEPKPSSKTYKALSLKQPDRNKDRRHMEKSKITKTEKRNIKNEERFSAVLPIVNENPELEEAKTGEVRKEEDTKNEDLKPAFDENEKEFTSRLQRQETRDKIIKTKEIINEEDSDEEDESEVKSVIEPIGDVEEIRDKIKIVENQIKLLEKKDDVIDNDITKGVTVDIPEENNKKEEVIPAETNSTESEKGKEDSQPNGEELQPEESNPVRDVMEEIQEEKFQAESANETSHEEKGEGNSFPKELSSETEDEKVNDVTDKIEGTVISTESGAPTDTPGDAQELTVNAEKLSEEFDDGNPSARNVSEEPEADQAAKCDRTEVKEYEDESQEPRSEVQVTLQEEQAADRSQAKEMELIAGEEPKNKILETDEDFIRNEKDFEEIQEVKSATQITIQTDLTSDMQKDKIEETAASTNQNSATIPKNTDTECKTSQEAVQTAESDGAENQNEVKPESPSPEIHANPPPGSEISENLHLLAGLARTETDITAANAESAEESNDHLSAEESLLASEAEHQETTPAMVQKFLDIERTHSSYDKCIQDKINNVPDESNIEESKIDSKIVPEIQLEPLKENEEKPSPMNEEKLSKPEIEGESSDIDVVEDGDDQDKEASTTSDEIEFEVSPSKEADIPADAEEVTKSPEEKNIPQVSVPDANIHNDVNTLINQSQAESDENIVKEEPRIVVELNKGESEEQGEDNTHDDMPKKTFLAVPGPVLEEYPVRKAESATEELSRGKRSADEETDETEGNKTGVTMECGNVGNEIIQRGEVQKVELIEGEEDILQVHLTTTIETEQADAESVHIEMTSKIEPDFVVSVVTEVESAAAAEEGTTEKMNLIRAAVVIQNGFRRFKKRKISREARHGHKDLDKRDISSEKTEPSTVTEAKLEEDWSGQGCLKDGSSRDSASSFSSSATKINKLDLKGRSISRSNTKALLETHSLDQVRKKTPLKTRSMSMIRYGVADFEVWNQLVKELEEAATKIQSNYRGYKTRKMLKRENAVQSTTTTSEDSISVSDAAEMNNRHTGEFHDSIVLPLPPE